MGRIHKFQSAPSQGGRLDVVGPLCLEYPVSIRALAGRATPGDWIVTGVKGVSIRALAGRATTG